MLISTARLLKIDVSELCTETHRDSQEVVSAGLAQNLLSKRAGGQDDVSSRLSFWVTSGRFRTQGVDMKVLVKL